MKTHTANWRRYQGLTASFSYSKHCAFPTVLHLHMILLDPQSSRQTIIGHWNLADIFTEGSDGGK
jgi:hypothetical protein